MTSPATFTGISVKNVLFPTGFSPNTEKALAYAVDLAQRHEATLYSVTVVPEEIVDYVQPPDPFYLLHTAEKKMALFSEHELLKGIRHQEFVKEGFVSEVLSEVIDRLKIDLAVLSTHGRCGISRIVRGSVAEEIINTVSCPVLTIGPKVPPFASPRARLRRILFVSSLLPGSKRAFAHAEWLAEQEQAHLTLLHVIKPQRDIDQASLESQIEEAKGRLRQFISPPAAALIETDCVVVTGELAEQILKAAEGENADLIVMGPHHTSFAKAATHLPWVTPHEVICHARCPVLTVRDTHSGNSSQGVIAEGSLKHD